MLSDEERIGFDIEDEIINVPLEYPSDEQLLFSPEHIRTKMGKAIYEFSHAREQLEQLETLRNTREKQTRIIILSRRFDLIQNERLRNHLILSFEDPKFKPTKDDLDSFIYMEHRLIFEPYSKWEKVAKQASREYDMWLSLLMWYQSKMKQERLERMEANVS